MKDLLLGEIEHHIDRWVGKMSWTYPHIGSNSLRFTITADSEGPSEEQKMIVTELKANYETLWPHIHSEIINLVHQNAPIFKPDVLLFIPGVIGTETYDFILGYELKNEDTPNAAYFLAFDNWKIRNAIKAI